MEFLKPKNIEAKRTSIKVSDMYERRRKRKPLEGEKERVSWADLPERAVEVIASRLYLYTSMNFRLVCKAWRGAAKQCLFDPQLVVSYQMTGDTPYLISVAEGKGLPIHLHVFDFRHSVGSSHGWLIMRRNDNFSEISLINIFNGSRIRLPPLKPKVKYNQVCLSSTPTSDDCILLVTLRSNKRYAFYRLGEGKWYVREFPNFFCKCGRNDIQHVVANGEQFYALTTCGVLVTIGDISEPQMVTSGEAIPANCPSRPAKQCRFLLHCQGKILVVVLWFCGINSRVFDVEVYRMHFPTYSWIKTEQLEDCILFVGNNCSFAVSTELTGSRGSYVFFLDGSENAWSVFDMEEKSIIVDKGGRWPCTDQNNRVWVLPTFV